MNDCTYYQKISVNADLCEASLEDAIIEVPAYFRQFAPMELLIVHPENAVMAGRLAQMHGLSVIVCPLLDNDAWAAVGGYSTVYSPGAG